MSRPKRPPQRAGTRARRPVDPNFCCLEWGRFPERSRTWGWQVVHIFAHSRTTFTVDTVATKAATETAKAREIVRDAVAYGWISPLIDQPNIYVGNLKPITRRPEAS